MKPHPPSSPDPDRTHYRLRLGARRHVHLGVAIGFVLALTMIAFAGMDLVARNLLLQVRSVTLEEAEPETTLEAAAPSALFTLEHLDLHPARRYAAWFDTPATSTRQRSAFHDLLDGYVTRQGRDDNFTIRVIDNRSGRTLEVFVLEQERSAYEHGAPVDWRDIDKKRAEETRRLSKKYQALGIPTDALTIRWGRAQQVREARERETAFIEYELALARHLGLSLLATEIGTVETFNEDHLISSAGARSRYQIMPYLLRQHGIEHYELRTASGRPVRVFEEWHPLLTMETAFVLMRAYANAVGHEIPGLSAYHTGPYNLFKLYAEYLTHRDPAAETPPHVADAFIWGLTDGFAAVSKASTFRERSRGYVPALYGSLRATESIPIDTSKTMRAERVQLRPGKHLFLSDLLRALEATGVSFDWGVPGDSVSLYERFRRLNPHIALPPAPAEGSVPVEGDVRLVDRAGDAEVAFFLPPGAAEALAHRGYDLFDPEATFRFDHDTFAPPEGEKTPWDRAYDTLVEHIGYFGFTPENRAYLDTLETRFRELAAANPSPYRLRQLRIISIHAQLWRSKFFDQLARTVAAHRGTLRAPLRPLEALPARNDTGS